MNHARLFSIGLKIFCWFCKLLGLCPFHFDWHKNLFEWTWLEIGYSALIWAHFSYFYSTSGLSGVASLNPLVVIAFFYLAMFTVAIVFMMQCLHAEKFVKLLNETEKLLEQLKPFRDKISAWHALRYGTLFICKTLVTSGIAQTASISCCAIICKLMTGKIDYFVIFIVGMGYLMQTIVPNMFYTFILGVSLHYHQLNEEIQEIIGQATEVMTNSTVDQMHQNIRMIQLSKQLDHVASLHGRITIQTGKVNKVFSLQLLITIGNFIAIILIELFLTYLFIVEAYLTHQPDNWALMLGILTYCVAAFIELHLLNAVCLDAMQKFHHGSNLLHEVLLLDLPPEYQRNLDMFSIQIKGHPLNITAQGFFRLDNALTFSSLSTIGGYLLILIQFQLAKSRILQRDTNNILNAV